MIVILETMPIFPMKERRRMKHRLRNNLNTCLLYAWRPFAPLDAVLDTVAPSLQPIALPLKLVPTAVVPSVMPTEPFPMPSTSPSAAPTTVPTVTPPPTFTGTLVGSFGSPRHAGTHYDHSIQPHLRSFPFQWRTLFKCPMETMCPCQMTKFPTWKVPCWIFWRRKLRMKYSTIPSTEERKIGRSCTASHVHYRNV